MNKNIPLVKTASLTGKRKNCDDFIKKAIKIDHQQADS